MAFPYQCVIEGDDINQVNSEGWTPLTAAASEGHSLFVRKLLLKGAHVNKPTAFGETALHLAASFGFMEVVRVLLDFDASTNSSSSSSWRSPLHHAAEHCQVGVVKLLIDHMNSHGRAIYVDTSDKMNMTPLQLAIWNCHTGVLQVFLENMIRPEHLYIRDNLGMTQIFLHAVQKNDLMNAKLLLERYPYVSIINEAFPYVDFLINFIHVNFRKLPRHIVRIIKLLENPSSELLEGISSVLTEAVLYNPLRSYHMQEFYEMLKLGIERISTPAGQEEEEEEEEKVVLPISTYLQPFPIEGLQEELPFAAYLQPFPIEGLQEELPFAACHLDVSRMPFPIAIAHPEPSSSSSTSRHGMYPSSEEGSGESNPAHEEEEGEERESPHL